MNEPIHTITETVTTVDLTQRAADMQAEVKAIAGTEAPELEIVLKETDDTAPTEAATDVVLAKVDHYAQEWHNGFAGAPTPEQAAERAAQPVSNDVESKPTVDPEAEAKAMVLQKLADAAKAYGIQSGSLAVFNEAVIQEALACELAGRLWWITNLLFTGLPTRVVAVDDNGSEEPLEGPLARATVRDYFVSHGAHLDEIADELPGFKEAFELEVAGAPWRITDGQGFDGTSAYVETPDANGTWQRVAPVKMGTYDRNNWPKLPPAPHTKRGTKLPEPAMVRFTEKMIDARGANNAHRDVGHIADAAAERSAGKTLPIVKPGTRLR